MSGRRRHTVPGPMALVPFLGLLLLCAPGWLPGQVSVAILGEPLLEPAERIRASLAREIPWETKRTILAEHDIRLPVRPPTELELTPRNPHRIPGGHLNMYTRTRESVAWSTEEPPPTGVIQMGLESRVGVYLVGMKPRYRYLLDHSLDTSSTGYFSAGTHCGGSGGPSGTRVNLAQGPQHVLIVAETDTWGSGLACWSTNIANGTGRTSLLKVQIHEIGPIP